MFSDRLNLALMLVAVQIGIYNSLLDSSNPPISNILFVILPHNSI